ncbi:hypothetical protein MSAN_01010900 [Mycena sanguinolenta]|uniref:Sulphur transport domain-containing protein n=1 Tax=Mycena sanguinolenta TaxID=230812 RepID=A0A8H6YLV0_9AGAR|nr:hypothetical protein MSAN_01010900 [Mycena sanguinolenta]
MSTALPLSSFLGGFGLSLSVHSLLVLNGQVFGISGFLHRAVRGKMDAIASVCGLLLGGLLAGLIDNAPPLLVPFPPERAIPYLLISGVLVGVGTRLANGCTSGHMIAGLSRFSPRSIAATATFVTTGVVTARLLHGNSLPIQSFDWSLGTAGKALLAFQAVPLLVSTLLYIHVRAPSVFNLSRSLLTILEAPRHSSDTKDKNPAPPSPLRLVASLTTAVEFALALRLSNLTDPLRVIKFLLLPLHEAFDPSLVFLATGALPMVVLLYRFARGRERPRLGGEYSIPKGGKIDARLITGAALFGVGWGISGFCPGPGLVNLGSAIGAGSNPLPTIGWLAAVVAGGLMI